MERLEIARRIGAKSRGLNRELDPVVVGESDPSRFMAGFARAVAGAGPVFLADPAWKPGKNEVLAEFVRRSFEAEETSLGRGWLMIPSGGTGGRLKFARHDQDTLSAAVGGFCAHFQTERVNCVGVLPLHHVSGLMAWMRTSLTGGVYVPWDWKRLEKGERPPRPRTPGFCTLSLVPTQLQRMIASADAVSWLREFDAVLVGGGPIWTELARVARDAGLPISLGYGMTETAAMVTALRPAEFLAGGENSGFPMPHCRVTIGKGGLISLAGESVFRGYFPAWRAGRRFTTPDLGGFDSEGRLRVIGRRDAVVITGGKKVDIARVEVALRSTGEFSDLAVIGLPDPEWGEAVTACYPAVDSSVDFGRVRARLKELATFEHPRRYLPIADWPRNLQGKINRAELKRLAQKEKV